MGFDLEDLINTASSSGKAVKCVVEMPTSSHTTKVQGLASERNDPVSAPTQAQMFTGADNFVSNLPPSSPQMVPLDQAPPLSPPPSSTQVMWQMNRYYNTQKQFRKNVEESELECEITRVLSSFRGQTIQQFPSRELPPQYFSAENLPKDLVRAATSLAGLTGLNTCLALILLLGSIPPALRGRYRLKYGEWLEALTGYFLALSSHGKRKTQALGRLKRAFDELLRKLLLQSYIDNLTANFTKQTHGVVYAYYNKEFRDELAEADIYDYDKIASLAEDHAQAMGKLSIHLKNKSRPVPRFFVDDVSIKKLATVMKDQGEFAAVMDTEASLINSFLSKKNFDYSLFLKSYNYEASSIESLNMGTVLLQDPALSILIFTQPTMLGKLLENPNLNDKGGLARFWPYLSEQTASLNSDEYNPEDMEIYDNKIRAMLERNFTQESPREIWTINVSDTAGKILDEFRVTIRQWEDNPDLEYMGGFLRKLAGSAMRLAGLIHCWRYDQPEQYSISSIDMQTGVELAKLLFSHAKYLYLPKKLDPFANAWKVANWITRFCDGARPSFTRRECQQYAHLHLNEALPALRFLESLNWIAQVQVGKELRYVVNPHMFGLVAAGR